jgi:GAF domain-containing protein/AmiR/NasT family two-component response regulator
MAMAKILVIDDELFYRELVADVLRKAGHQVTVGKDSRDALDLFKREEFDLCFLDVVLPGQMDGLAVLGKFHQQNPDVPVIMLTGHEDQRLVLRALRQGAFDYQRKPISAQELRIAADRALATRKLSVEHRQKLKRMSSLEEGAKRLTSWVGQTFRIEDLEREYEMLESTVKLVSEVLECERVSVMLLDPVLNRLRVVVSTGLSKSQIKQESREAGKSVSSYVLDHEEAVLVTNVAEDPRFQASEYAGQYRTGSFVIAPLQVGAQVIGTINANDKKGSEPFSEDDLVMLKTFSHQVSLTYVHALAVADLEREKNHLKLLNDLQRILLQYTEPEEMLRQMLLKCQELLDVVSASVFLKDELSGELCLRLGLSGLKPITKIHRIPVGQSLTGLVAQTNQVMIANNPAAEPRFQAALEWPDKGTIRNLIAAPLVLSNQTIGVLRLLNRREGGFSAEDGRLLKDIADSLAVAIRNLQLYEQLQKSVGEVVAMNRMLQQANDELNLKAKELEALKKK